MADKKGGTPYAGAAGQSLDRILLTINCERRGGKESVFVFVGFVEVEEGLDVSAVGEAAGAFHLFEFFGLVVAPAALGEEGVEHEDFLIVGPATVREAPFEDGVVRRAGQGLFDDGGYSTRRKRQTRISVPAPCL
jgi:hypothetical protein